MINIVMDSQILTTLQTCPRLYNFRFNQNLVPSGGKSNSLEIGSLAHTILEWYFKGLVNGATRKESIEIGMAAGHEYIRGYSPDNKYVTDPNEKGMVTGPESTRYIVGHNFVLDTMERYFEFYSSDNFVPLQVEHVLGNVIYEDEEMRVIWKAKYDLIADFPDGIMPMDHKTSKTDYHTSSMNNQFMGQCVLTNTRRMLVNKIGFQKTKSDEERFYRVVVNYSADRLYEWKNEIVPHYARMLYAYTEAENFPPQFTGCSTKYGDCSFAREVCNTDRNLRETAIKTYFEIGKKWDVSND